MNNIYNICSKIVVAEVDFITVLIVLVGRFLGEHLIGVLIEAAGEVCFFEGDSRCVFL